MSDVLKGNFTTRAEVKVEPPRDETLEERFERAALTRLGGSIAFVAKRKVMWDAKEQ